MGLKRDVSLKDALRYKGNGPMLTYILTGSGGWAWCSSSRCMSWQVFLMNQPWGASVASLSIRSTKHWLFQIFIFFCVIFHMINGLRITVLDLWPKLIEYQREAIWLEWVVFLPVYGMAVYIPHPHCDGRLSDEPENCTPTRR